jgi:hypothetical protein
MRRKYILIVTIAIIVFFSEYFIIASRLASITSISELQDFANLPNRGFTDIRYFNDNLSDSNGNRAFPWGIETDWTVNGVRGSPSSYFDVGQVKLTGYSVNDVAVLAIPNPPGKPLVMAGLNYTQSFEIKLDNVQGHGVRLMYQSFNSGSPSYEIIQTVYGTFENGTSDWHTISLTATAINGSVVGDVICELWGTGTVYIKNPEFHSTTVVDILSQATASDIAMWLIVGFVIVILIVGLIALMSFAVKPLRRKVNESFKHSKHKRLSNEVKHDEN